MIFYVVNKFERLIYKLNEEISTKILSVDVEKVDVNFEEAKTMLFWVLRETEGYQRPLKLDRDDIVLEQYIELSAIQWESNWHLPKEQWHNYTKIPLRRCELRDFCFTRTNEECNINHNPKFGN